MKERRETTSEPFRKLPTDNIVARIYFKVRLRRSSSMPTLRSNIGSATSCLQQCIIRLLTFSIIPDRVTSVCYRRCEHYVFVQGRAIYLCYYQLLNAHFEVKHRLCDFLLATTHHPSVNILCT